MITAIVLAAGSSLRMGRAKMSLPWGESTILGHVLKVIAAAGVEDRVVVTGAAREEVEEICRAAGVRTTHNSNYEAGDMLSSLQAGLRTMAPETQAALVVLGDQPGIEEAVARAVIQSHLQSRSALVVPSYGRRRGHPWLVARERWSTLLRMQSPDTPRSFLNAHSDSIQYVEAGSPSILDDIDTPEDYTKSRPRP